MNAINYHSAIINTIVKYSQSTKTFYYHNIHERYYVWMLNFIVYFRNSFVFCIQFCTDSTILILVGVKRYNQHAVLNKHFAETTSEVVIRQW